MKNEDSVLEMDDFSMSMDRRRDKRLKGENEVTLSFPSALDSIPKGTIIYTVSKDISATGIRILAHRFLPVNTMLRIKVAFKASPQMVTVLGKVKWIRSVFADEDYEAGLEFSSPLI